jgi:hypothetical protein
MGANIQIAATPNADTVSWSSLSGNGYEGITDVYRTGGVYHTAGAEYNDPWSGGLARLPETPGPAGIQVGDLNNRAAAAARSVRAKTLGAGKCRKPETRLYKHITGKNRDQQKQIMASV